MSSINMCLSICIYINVVVKESNGFIFFVVVIVCLMVEAIAVYEYIFVIYPNYVIFPPIDISIY